MATNLIANNKLLGEFISIPFTSYLMFISTSFISSSAIHFHLSTEGTQLLSLIDKGLDSCRYLQTYGKWYYSVWLAKSTLNEKETKEVYLRWVDHLTSTSVNQKVLPHLLN